MSGIRFNLKKKGNGGVEKPKISISLGKGLNKGAVGGGIGHHNRQIKPLQSTRIGGGANAFGTSVDDDDEEGKVVQIDSFDADTIRSSTSNDKDAGHQLVIKPVVLKRRINDDEHDKDRDKQLQQQEENDQKSKLNYGLTSFVSSEETVPSEQEKEGRILQARYNELPDEDSEEEYEKVPVEKFGEALLRGMGWTPDADEEEAEKGKVNLHQQRGPVLGIGAKSIDSGLYDDIRGSQKLQAPLLKRDKQTGEIIPHE